MTESSGLIQKLWLFFNSLRNQLVSSARRRLWPRSSRKKLHPQSASREEQWISSCINSSYLYKRALVVECTILLDTEGIDAYDQTGTYSTQIFSLAVLLSSLFIFNQMGGIDETVLDQLSLVTEMTKLIRVRASGGMTTASELGQFSPIFVWLLRDFYLELVEEKEKIMPSDYLELALRPVQGSGKDIAAKNKIRESIRALFPYHECFTLVWPLNSETELQQLDQTSLNKLRPEFRSGLDALTSFVFARTRPKQIGATIMNGPMLAGLTQSYLDALNNGAVPTISSSWQSVEETECRKAYN